MSVAVPVFFTKNSNIAYSPGYISFISSSIVKSNSYISKTLTRIIVIFETESLLSEVAVTLNLENKTYQWKVKCVDREGNSNSSETRTFTTNNNAILNELSVNLDDQDKETEDIIGQINKIIESLEQLGTKEKEAAEDMQLKKTLEKAITQINRANRDLHSLKWRNLNDTESIRYILNKIPDLEIIEPIYNKEHVHCCGWSGTAHWADKGLAIREAKNRITELKETGHVDGFPFIAGK